MQSLRAVLRRQKQPTLLRQSFGVRTPRFARPLTVSRALRFEETPAGAPVPPQPTSPPEAVKGAAAKEAAAKEARRKRLEEDLLLAPPHCPGCGAPSQIADPDSAGYYGPTELKRVKRSLGVVEPKHVGDKIWEETVERLKREGAAPEVLEALGVKDTPSEPMPSKKPKASPEPEPLCARCHNLIHYQNATPLPSYPTLMTLAKLITESPHTHNHIYHTVDAADMPVSMQPHLMGFLHKHLPKSKFRNLSISYVVTRCDLLVHKREMLSGLESRIKTILKRYLPEHEKLESFGPFRENNRLHFTSSKQGWGIGKLKEEMKGRKGGVWFFGAVNTGKSSLIRDLWPEGAKLKAISDKEAAEFGLLPHEQEISDEAWAEEMERRQEQIRSEEDADAVLGDLIDRKHEQAEQAEQTEKKQKPSSVQKHVAPTISHIPGTTAAPLRILYQEKVARNTKVKTTEFVDLPGIERWVGMGDDGLNKYVFPEYRKSIFLAERGNRKKVLIDKDQAMLLGGLFYFIPRNTHPKNYHMLIANPFTALGNHVGRANKVLKYFAITNETAPDQLNKVLIQDPSKLGEIPPPEPRQPGWDTPQKEHWEKVGIDTSKPAKPAYEYFMPSAIKSAGVFRLTEDVTLQRNPWLPERSPEAVDALPYKVYGTDIVIDGVGFVELTAQVRRDPDGQFRIPEVEIFSPEGKGVYQRPILGLYMHWETWHRESAWISRKKAGKRLPPSAKGKKRTEKLLRKAGLA